MRRIQLDEDVRPLSEFRANVAAFIEKVRKTKRPLVVTQRGKSAAVLLDVGEYEALIDELELLQDIRTGEKQINDGKGVNHKEARKEILKSLDK